MGFDRGQRLLVGICGLIAGLLSGLGCGDLSLSSSGGGQVAGAITTAAPAPPSPQIQLLSPSPASFLYPGPTAVSGRALPAAGSSAPIRLVRVNGREVSVQPDGTFQDMVDVVPGMNVIQATAVDAEGVVG